ncbi:UDP-glucose flavonoid 3-O-glucosyltransferase 7 [Platanthera zijinensis]|uniref:UDP-glucose flavonoid 3-O-glucosyltransferase 7 n=1 Tax=Platanthera zijinensis TaxID=2320716 RepID=A0AAP0FWU6_9ASPA
MGVKNYLRLPFDEILRYLSLDCVISDFFMPWTYDVAFAHGVPRLAFDGFSFFTRCLLEDAYVKQNPMHDLAPDAQTFILHSLPDSLEFLRSQFPDPDEFAKNTTLYRIWNEALEVNQKSYGMVVNSFYELEPDYAEPFGK